MDNIIEINNLNLKYKNLIVFDKLNLKIKKGDFVTIAGNGKTSLSNIINKYNKNVTINGDLIVLKSEINSNFYDESIKKNLVRVMKNNNVSDEEIKENIKKIIKFFDLKDMLDYNPKYLSNGEKYLISILIALCNKPDIVVFDETLSMLDGINKEKIFKSLKKCNKELNMTIVNLTNDLEESIISKRIILIDKNIKLNKNIQKAYDNISIYNDLNLEIPFMVNLSNKLKYYDLVDKNLLNMDKLVNHLWK